MNNYYAIGFIYSIYKIGAREKVHTSGVEGLRGSEGFRGSVSGFDGRTARRDRSRTTEVDLVASRKKDLVRRQGCIRFALVGAVLVVTKVLSGRRIGSVLAFGKKNLACDVVGIGAGRRSCRSVSVILASGFSANLASGTGYLSHQGSVFRVWTPVEVLVVP